MKELEVKEGKWEMNKEKLESLGWSVKVANGMIYFNKGNYYFDLSIIGGIFDIDFPTLGTVSAEEFQLMIDYRKENIKWIKPLE